MPRTHDWNNFLAIIIAAVIIACFVNGSCGAKTPAKISGFSRVGNFEPVTETGVHGGRIPAVIYRSSRTGLKVVFVRAGERNGVASGEGYLTVASEVPSKGNNASSSSQSILEPLLFMGTFKHPRTEVLDHLARRCLAACDNEENKALRPCYKLRAAEGSDGICTMLPLFLDRKLIREQPEKTMLIVTGRSDPARILKCVNWADKRFSSVTEKRKELTSTRGNSRDSRESRRRRRRRSDFYRNGKPENALLVTFCGKLD